MTIFGLQTNLLFANGTTAQTIYSEQLSYHASEMLNAAFAVVPSISSEDLKGLSPVTPAEADFSDNDLVTVSSSAAITLAPATPTEADFKDSDADNLSLLLPELAPVIPGEADFPDADTINNVGTVNLAPMVPAEATFEDHI